jgi:plasmid stability protein
MTCSIPHDIEQRLTVRAAKRQMTVEQLVLEALSWYLGVEEETLDELAAWQQIRDEAGDLIEGQAP